MLTEVCFDTTTYASILQLDGIGCLGLGNVLRCPDNLSIGKICPFNFKQRERALRIHGIIPEPNFVEKYCSFCDGLCEATSVRIWSSNSPHEFVGLCFACSILSKKIKCIKICSVTKLPHSLATCTSELLFPNEWIELKKQEYRDTPQEYDNIWGKFITDNTELRIMVGGTPTSVEANFWDDDIYNLLSENNSLSDYEVAEVVIEQYKRSNSGLISIEFLLKRIRNVRKLCENTLQ